ncbi:hypothetical protein [Sulfurospirillum sp. 1612]|uniref:hypothetical protein n=1 Tax=Sulfurospirillum sp. 1612 TaxID=3094835 RepID=UPI002F92BF9A
MKHAEIINALKKIPQLSNEYSKYEASLSGTRDIKKTLSPFAYMVKILEFEAGSSESTKLYSRIYSGLFHLQECNADFNAASYITRGRKNLEKIVGKYTTKKENKTFLDQLMRLDIITMQKNFTSLTDLLDKEKIKNLEKFLRSYNEL